MIQEFSKFRKENGTDVPASKPVEEVNEQSTVKETESSPLYQTHYEAVKDTVVEEHNSYKIYRDKAETFICDMEITGAKPNNSKARIILECADLTYMFEGTIDENGHCRVPLRKMNFLDENQGGLIKLEVIAEDMVFSPWQDNFVAVNSRKVEVKRVVESEQSTPKVGITVKNIR